VRGTWMKGWERWAGRADWGEGCWGKERGLSGRMEETWVGREMETLNLGRGCGQGIPYSFPNSFFYPWAPHDFWGVMRREGQQNCFLGMPSGTSDSL
jgi:hypothetical protein